MKTKRLMALALVLATVAAFAVALVPSADAGSSGPAPANLQAPPATAELVDLGRATFTKQCVPCHGANGNGEGPAAYLLYPKPRDFTSGKFLLVSTWDRVPTDFDLFGAITRGLPGSAMPSWGHLPERTRWGLVNYIKSLAETPWQIQEPTDPHDGMPGTGIIRLPPEPEWNEAARTRAWQLYGEACKGCHGPTGKGDGAQAQFDEKGYPTRPRDLTLGVFKGDPAPEAIFRHILAGMPGTPMPMSDWAYGTDGWHLVHLVRSLSSDEQRTRVEMKKFRIVAHRVAALPDHPDDGLWNEATPINLHLMPLWWRAERPEELTVRALHDGSRVAISLTWADDTHDATAMRVQDFRDAVAVQFALDPDPPFFAMGAKGQFVNIWMWKSEKQADIETPFQDLDSIYPNIGIDSYPNTLKRPEEQPTRHALTLESDPSFVTGWAAGNIVSDRTRRSAAEDLRAQGFGTLRARATESQPLKAEGVWSTGSYRVMFTRPLAVEGEGAVNLAAGTVVPVGFAVWNGTAGDRDGKKSVTIWQELELQP
jgi:mono/diheme cytochrome c family protein